MTALNEPLHLRRGPVWQSRLALAPLTNTQSNPDGSLSDDEINWLLVRSRGFGMVMTAAAYVSPEGKAWQGQLGVCDDLHNEGLKRLAHGIAETGARSSVQLHHGGYRAEPDASGHPRVAPFDDVDTGARALTTDEVHHVIDDFVAAAVRSEKAGFDGVELHGAHGYLLGQFLEPRNQRDDGFGGDFEGRTRALWQIIEGIRSQTSNEFQLGLRLSAERFGLVTSDMVELAGTILADGRIDYLDLSLWDINKQAEGAAQDSPTLLSQFLQLPRHGTALSATGHISTAGGAKAALETGLDFAVIGRASIGDKDFAERALSDSHYAGPTWPVNRDHLREQGLGEAFVDYFVKGWPQLVTD